MKLKKILFSFTLITIVLIYVFIIMTDEYEDIEFAPESLQNNNAINVTLDSGDYKVGKDISSGIYDIHFTEDTILNNMQFLEGTTLNNITLNHNIFLSTNKNIDLTPSENIYFTKNSRNGLYIAKEDSVYSIKNIDEETHSVVYINPGSSHEEYSAVDYNTPENEFTLQAGDIVFVTSRDLNSYSDEAISISLANSEGPL